MSYLTFRNYMRQFLVFSIQDIKKAFPGFDTRRLVEWQQKGYLCKVINRWYAFTDVSEDGFSEEYLAYWTANRIYAPSYLSLETALSHHGLIPEGVYTITSVSSRKTQTFNTPLGHFTYRRVKPALFFGYQIIDWQGFPIRMADREKVILDYLYLNPHLRSSDDWEGLRLNADTLGALNRTRLYDYLTLFANRALEKRVDHLLNYLQRC